MAEGVEYGEEDQAQCAREGSDYGADGEYSFPFLYVASQHALVSEPSF